MPEKNFEFSGWQAIVVLAALAGIIVVRFLTLNDMSSDEELMKQINTLLQDEYSPAIAQKMQDAYDTGDKDTISDAVKSITSTKVNIIAVQASYPIFKFSLPKDVVIKVVFSLDDATTQGEEKTIFYLFKKGVFGWQYQYITTSFSYYSNFM